jgi:hypothetical protein
VENLFLPAIYIQFLDNLDRTIHQKKIIQNAIWSAAAFFGWHIGVVHLYVTLQLCKGQTARPPVLLLMNELLPHDFVNATPASDGRKDG